MGLSYDYEIPYLRSRDNIRAKSPDPYFLIKPLEPTDPFRSLKESFLYLRDIFRQNESSLIPHSSYN